MTRKLYTELAKAFIGSAPSDADYGARVQYGLLVREVGMVLAADNPFFSLDKWLTATKYEQIAEMLV